MATLKIQNILIEKYNEFDENTEVNIDDDFLLPTTTDNHFTKHKKVQNQLKIKYTLFETILSCQTLRLFISDS